ncbi:MAG: DUF3108 domain-containing protein [Proteobacteria bacterium]|nr:DUF3108 domain-containing protein [Pseudomonadota bacterium]
MEYLEEHIMKFRIWITIGFALTFIGWSLALAQNRTTTSVERPFFRRRGFNYRAEKFGVRILEAIITLEEARTQEGKKVYVARARVGTTGVTHWLFRMHNQFDSWVDARNLGPLRYVKEIHQKGIFSGEKHYRSVLTFSRGDNRVVVDGKKEVTIPPGTQDPLSFFVKYYLQEEIEPGDEIRMSIYDGIKLRGVTFSARGESIETEWCGLVEVICLESKVPFSSLGEREGIIKIWFTRDERKVPVRIGLELPIGTVTFELESFDEG